MPAGRTLRLELMAPSRVRYSTDGRQRWADLDARDTGLGVWVADIPGSDRLASGAAVDFTFWWPEAGRWEGRDIRVEVVPAER
jgi:glucoamylase